MSAASTTFTRSSGLPDFMRSDGVHFDMGCADCFAFSDGIRTRIDDGNPRVERLVVPPHEAANIGTAPAGTALAAMTDAVG